PVKITMPGPMTIGDTTVDAFYGDPQKRGADLADALNKEVIALANEGCQHIQIDEPLFARNPADALDFGFENLERAFYKAPRTVTRTVHMCCGYPDRLDSVEYPKADPESYALLAGSIEDSCIDAVSLEDAHRQNDLSLLNSFNQTTVILGVIAIASSKIETVDEIEERLRLVLNHIDSDRLIAAPDCGLGLLGRSLALQKLSNLGQAAKRI
ncbi:MAG: 5-methyltetrahydropteroyltriglutamate--homocysteine methyltransferase, partial [Proteobacteria bacterium]|nr:5-methyltetrahydropteroyltriglutamate--homocysteine methyltransferase [Pseudomonadota bacterium]